MIKRVSVPLARTISFLKMASVSVIEDLDSTSMRTLTSAENVNLGVFLVRTTCSVKNASITIF